MTFTTASFQIQLNLDPSITAFQLSNEELFPNKRLLIQRIREIRQKLMSYSNQERVLTASSS